MIFATDTVFLLKKTTSIISLRKEKVQASLQANTYVISGSSEKKPINEMLPQIMNQMGMGGMGFV